MRVKVSLHEESYLLSSCRVKPQCTPRLGSLHGPRVTLQEAKALVLSEITYRYICGYISPSLSESTLLHAALSELLPLSLSRWRRLIVRSLLAALSTKSRRRFCYLRRRSQARKAEKQACFFHERGGKTKENLKKNECRTSLSSWQMT